MIRRNIFIRDYKVSENIITESLMDFLSNLSPKILNIFLNRFVVHVNIKDINNINFDMQEKEEKSIPDATIYDTKNFYIHIESKVVKRSIRELQLHHHFNALKNKPQKKKVLLVITNDFDEPMELKRFRKTHKDRNIQIRFLSWSQIRDFMNNIYQNLKDKKDKFLIKQFNEYLEAEKMAITKWHGFNKEDERKWAAYIDWYDNLRRILDDIREHIRARKEDCEISGINEKSDNLYFLVITWRKRKRKIRCYIGIEYKLVPLKMEKIIYFYIQWHWSTMLKNELLKKHNIKFNKIKEKLRKKGYKLDPNGNKDGNNDLYKSFYFADIIKKDNADEQKKIIFSFFDVAIRDLEACGLEQLIKKITI